MISASSTRKLTLLACLFYLLTGADMLRDYSSPYNDPCGASATQAHQGDIAYITLDNDGAKTKRGATAIRERLWPNASIPYEISPVYNDEERNGIYEAMRQWEENTCIRFYERPSDHTESYIYIFKGGCCASFVGRQTDNLQQGLSLGASCRKLSTRIHELGHAIGFWHEQSRPDREEYINLLWNNMMSGSQSNFRVEEIDSLGVGYDYNSIMHYSSTAFGGGQVTIEAVDPSIPVGEAVGLSDLDILQANLLYQCDTYEERPILTPPVVYEEPTEMPPLSGCGEDFIITNECQYAGMDFFSENYPTYSHNQECVYRIVVPEGTILNVTVLDLNLEWSRGCTKDSLTIYKTVDGTGSPKWYPRCGSGSDMSIIMDGTVAYVKYVTDGENEWEGRRGFYATFEAKDIDECADNNGGCSQHCVNHVPGYECHCDFGWFLSEDLKTCFDMNECAILNGGCQHKCVNSGGSFACECPEGSTLNADGKTCTNPDASCDLDNGGCDHVCSEDAMGTSCHCRQGFTLHSDGTTCGDFNECLDPTTCSHGCQNTLGSYECLCPDGYQQTTPTDICVDINECDDEEVCADVPGSECLNTEGSFECVFTASPTILPTEVFDSVEVPAPTIVPVVNECNTNNGGCSHTCVDTEDSYLCECPTGYEFAAGDSHNCVDIDECSENPTYCDSGCSNTDGSFICTCAPGYMLNEDGHSCGCGGHFTTASGSFSTPGWPNSYPIADFECVWTVDLPNPDAKIHLTIDESAYGIKGNPPCNTDHVVFYDGMEDDAEQMHKLCRFDVPEEPIITSTSQGKVIFTGSYYPRRGSKRVGVRITYTTVEPAVLVNECNTNNGGCSHTCVDTEELYFCECPTGYELAAGDSHNCVLTLVNECNTNNGGCSHTCVDTEDSYMCECPTGYEFTVGDSHNCVLTLVNECNTNNGGCSHTCVDTEESYFCECPTGYEFAAGDSHNCVLTLVNECNTNNGGCSHTCVDTEESYLCECPTGYELAAGDSHNCVDIDECSENPNYCDSGCSNTDGSFICTCAPGYMLNEDGHSCKCGGHFTTASGSFNTPGWPDSYPIVDFECVWTVDLPNPDATIHLTIDESHYGIKGNPPCLTDHVVFYDGMEDDAEEMHKLCKFDVPDEPIITSTSQGKVIFTGSYYPNRGSKRVGVRITYTTVEPAVLVNECDTNNGGCSHTCVDTEESYMCECPTGYELAAGDSHNCVDIDECSENPNYCDSGCSNTDGSFICTCAPGYMLNEDGHSCGCGGHFTTASGSFSTPGWPVSYPIADFECVWTIDLPNPDATIHLTIDESAYGIKGNSPCLTDHVVFYDGMEDDAEQMHKLCRFDVPEEPIITSTSQGKVIFTGSYYPRRGSKRVGVRITYTTVEDN